jgi:hypothetical protein
MGIEGLQALLTDWAGRFFIKFFVTSVRGDSMTLNLNGGQVEQRIEPQSHRRECQRAQAPVSSHASPPFSLHAKPSGHAILKSDAFGARGVTTAFVSARRFRDDPFAVFAGPNAATSPSHIRVAGRRKTQVGTSVPFTP